MYNIFRMRLYIAALNCISTKIIQKFALCVPFLDKQKVKDIQWRTTFVFCPATPPNTCACVCLCGCVCVCCLCRCVQLGLHLNLTTKFLVCIFFWTCSDSFSSARLILVTCIFVYFYLYFFSQCCHQIF